MIEFNKVSNESYFIKNLLNSTFLPRFRTVREHDYILKDRIYIYKCNIIKCTNSGYIVVKNANLDFNEYPESTLRKSDDEKIKAGQIYYEKSKHGYKRVVGRNGDNRHPRELGWYEPNVASFNILGEYHFGERNNKLCYNFLSSSEGYDYKTHEHLGMYLRGLRDMYDLNLMPLYNCFSNQLLRNIHITSDEIRKTSADYSTKVYKVPIRFNTDYTICMNNVGMTTIAPAFIRHGTLLTLSNNRFGNGLDVTNKYIKLNHNDVIHNEPNLRFRHPIKIRFDNVPKNKVINYSGYAYTEIPSNYNPKYYRAASAGAYPTFKKQSEDVTIDEYGNKSGPWIVADYNNPYLVGNKNYIPGYKFVIDDGSEYELKANDNVYVQDEEGDNKLILPKPKYELFESLNPSIGTFEDITKSYKQCPKDETFFGRNIFNSNKEKYYTYDEINHTYIQCTSSSVYNEDTVYYYIDKEDDNRWYEFIDSEFVPTEDTYIHPDKVYYQKERTEVPLTYNYDITEDNCCMYDYIEDNLYMLIQVPASYDHNIIILEGDYTDIAKEKYYNDNNFEVFSRSRLDHLFTDHLMLMETQTKKIRPFSETLIQYLLWHVICNLDTINNDMDRLSDDLSVVSVLDSRYTFNYWSDRYRQLIFDFANTYPKQYIRDNLGYVTTDIEKSLRIGSDFLDGDVLNENISYDGTYEEEEE